MKIFSFACLFIILSICASIFPQISADYQERVTCTNKKSPCFLKSITCPTQCPSRKPKYPKAKACFINCNGVGAACYDPRFIGADGAVFYFHGRSNEHFTLVSDSNVQINAHFIGHRPLGRSRDYTWIQGLGVLFGQHKFSVEATKAAKWDNTVDHLKFSYDGVEVVLPQGGMSSWKSAQGEVTVERVSNTNSVIISLPSDDCFSHLEVQFRFFDLSPEVEGVLGRTYRPDYESHARLGIAMPVVGGEDKYRTTSLFAADCKKCVFSPIKNGDRKPNLETTNYGVMDCSDKFSAGSGIAWP